MKKPDFKTFLKTKGFTEKTENHYGSEKYVITFSSINNEVSIFSRIRELNEPFIIRTFPPTLVDIYNLDDVELKDEKIKPKKD